MHAGLEEMVKIVIVYIEGLRQIKGQTSGIFPEQEVFLIAVGIGDGLTTAGISEGGAVDVGYFAHLGEEEGYLEVFALVCVWVEEVWVVLHGPAYPVVAIQCCAEVDAGSFVWCQDAGEHFFAVDIWLAEALFPG